MKRSVTFESGSSSKFWSVETTNKTMTVTWGRIGTEGTSKTTTFADSKACDAEAEKLLREKLKKGYVEAKAAAAPKKVDAPKTKKADVPATSPSHGLPPSSEFARSKRHPDFETFTPEDMELFHLGYPNLLLLEDGHRDDKNAEKSAGRALDSVDRSYGVVWPARVAMAYAFAFPSMPRKDASRFAERMALFGKTQKPDADTARDLLRAFVPGDDTYSGWRAPPAFYALEHAIGAEALALIIVESLAAVKSKDCEGKGYSHVNITLEVLGFLMLRVADAARQRVQKAIDALRAKRPKGDRLAKHLGYLPDHALDMPLDVYSNTGGPWFMEVLSVSTEQRWKPALEYGPGRLEVRALYLEGCAQLAGIDLTMWLGSLSKAQMLTAIDTFGRVKHPQTVRLMLALGKFKSVTAELQAWHARNADYIAQVLPKLERDPFVKAGLGMFSGTQKPMKKAANAMAATNALLVKLEKALPKAFPKQAKVTALVLAAANEAREIARLDGQDYPEVYFTALWAEFPFSLKVSDKEFELLSNAYEEVIIDGAS